MDLLGLLTHAGSSTLRVCGVQYRRLTLYLPTGHTSTVDTEVPAETAAPGRSLRCKISRLQSAVTLDSHWLAINLLPTFRDAGNILPLQDQASTPPSKSKPKMRMIVPQIIRILALKPVIPPPASLFLFSLHTPTKKAVQAIPHSQASARLTP